MKDQFAFLSQKKFWIEIVALVAALLVGAAAVYYFLIQIGRASCRERV